MIKYCIFDLDGTLLDTLDTITYYMNKTLEAHGIKPLTRDECQSFVGKGARNLMTRALESRGITDKDTVESILSEYVADYDSDPYYLTKPYEGIEALIYELRAAGMTLGVLSNKPELATRAAITHFFGDAFSLVHGGREGVPLKPSPDATFAMLREIGASPSEICYIGDSDVDVLTAKNFSPALALFCLWGFRTRDELMAVGGERFVSHPSEISAAVLNK